MWDECLEAWLKDDLAEKLQSTVGHDIVWRSRGKRSAELLAAVLKQEQTGLDEAPRYFRAFDFLDSAVAKSVLANIAFGQPTNVASDAKAKFMIMEAASRLSFDDLTEDQLAQMSDMIESSRGTPEFITAVGKFSSKKHYPDLLQLTETTDDRQMAAEAMGVLMIKGQGGMVQRAVVEADESKREQLCDALVNCGKREAAYLLAGVAKRTDVDLSLRSYAINRLGEIRSGAGDMLWWIGNKQPIDPAIMPAIKAALHSAKWPEVKQQADQLFPMPPSKDNRPLPSIGELILRSGNTAAGKKVFAGSGTCAKCHVVNKEGIEVGPDLSEIGSKLTKTAMYESIFFPSAGISHNYENWMVITADGEMITGILLGETDQEIQIKDDKGIKHTIPIDDVEGKKQQQLSLMPDGLHKEMSEQELVDLVAYLVSLKKK
ncbi:c-type cytochrome [bacterium]|nr:c-type cytochrome [bacterium]